jgi:hypothetical protein
MVFDCFVRGSNMTSVSVLQCIRTMHEQTELDMMEGKFYEKVFLGLQRTSRELRHAMDGGPNGGLQGCAVDVLWRVSYGEEVSNISDSTLRLLDILTMAKQGSKGDELFHMASTDRVQWFTKGKIGLTKVQCGVQTMRAYNFQDAMKASTHCAVQDVDTRLTAKLWNHRAAQSSAPRFDELGNNWLRLSELVHSRHQVNSPEIRNLWLPVYIQAMVVAVSNHNGWDPGRAFWRSLRHHETAPTRFDIDVDFDGKGNAGDVSTGILLADDDPG